MPFTPSNNISVTCKDSYAKNGFITNLQARKATIDTLNVANINNPSFACLRKKFDSMFIQSDVSGCVVSDLTPQFKDLICDTVANWCPYYYCTDCGVPPVARGLTGFNNLNNFNSSDNSNSFFHEEIINDDNLSNMDFSITETENTNINTYSKFISKNLLADVNLVSNNLKIISVDKISKGKWLFNGNIAVEIPASTSVSNIKLFVYLNENVVSSGEIDLGSHSQVGEPTIKSCPFNLMFKNDLEGGELKIGIISFDNKNEIKLLETTNFFANQM